MLGRKILVACVIVVVLAQFPQTSIGKQNRHCAPSSCGDIHNISYPFRLKTDPKNCGETSYELACEENLTVSYSFPQKYYVKAINYNNFTIRLIDATVQKDNCSSLPHNSLTKSNFHLNKDPYIPYNHRWGSHYMPEITKPINIISCPYWVDSPLYVDAGPCMNGSSTSYYYAKLGHLKASDVRDLCRIELMVMTSSPVKDDNNLSFLEIHDALLYGFELSWFKAQCPNCKQGYCYINQANNVICTGYCTILSLGVESCGTVGWLEAIGKWALQLLVMGIGLNFALRIICGIPCTFTFLIYTLRRRHMSMFDIIEGYLQSQNNLMPIRYTYSEIKKMTSGFKDKLGEGGYGCVYKGKLRSGGLVAIKLLGKSKANGQDFINEVSTIGRIHHVNVVRLIGFCAERSKRALVYEFMTNGSLEKYVPSREENISMLSWEKKYEIVLGVARGIEYLHRGCDIQILHFDIKPHNILLDNNFIPKVSDFGLAKLCPTDKNTVSLTAARGTIGYVAPELINRSIGGVSYKADVYSFGMLLMEILDLKRNPIATEENSSQYFPSWVYDRLKKGKDIEMRDCSDDDENKVTRKMTLVGLWCIQMNPVDRPSMTKVTEMLEGEAELLQMPPNSSDSPRASSFQEPIWSRHSTDSVASLSDSNHVRLIRDSNKGSNLMRLTRGNKWYLGRLSSF